eukprot:TRINITY_DN6696_c0_g1_i1.p1 TRINITY_DN6696_c0_g1~~TRINITY_DN6696_c0_g1_i1.p1  ORF type:complete len:158 (-),score=27.13 TRINITY_DN6696_c0_g1_i1:99-572(-)
MGIGNSKTSNLKTVPYVDLTKYQGLWYQIETNSYFSRDYDCVTAKYTPQADGTIEVFNRCRKPNSDQWKDITGKAWPVDETNAKLKVQFFWPIRADYWIMDLDADYQWALVLTPSVGEAWILARTPNLDEGIIKRLEEEIVSFGLDLSKFKRTHHDC